MVKYRCKICRRKFSTRSGLTQHANAKHGGRTSLSQPSQIQQRSQQSAMMTPKHNMNLWSIPSTMSQETISNNSSTLENSTLQVDSSDIMKGVVVGENNNDMMANVVVNEPCYNLQNRFLIKSHK